MKLASAAALALLLLPACLENEESITVRPDGSCSVRVLAKGQARDFAEGYPLPTGPEWKLVRGDLPEYLGWIRTPLGSEELRNLLPRDKDAQLEFELEAEFAELGRLPRSYAPAGEAYRSAYLARTSTLSIEARGAKTLYTFERRFGAREFARLDAWSRVQRALPGELVEKLERAGGQELELAPPEFEAVLAAALSGLHAAALAHLDDALLAEYTLGEARLPAAAAAGIRARAEQAIERALGAGRLRAVLELLLEPAPASKQAGARLEALEVELREALRQSVREAPAAPELRNAILAQLEASLTAFDQTNDLGDEDFRLRLSLPGALVGGNYDKLEDGAAVWEFRGDRLQDRELVLRAVSIVE